MKVVKHMPEAPVTEDWAWQTDIHVTDDGSEQRIMLSPLPKRALRQRLVIDSEQEVAQLVRALYGMGEPHLLPFYHQAVPLKAPAPLATSALSVNALRSEFRAGARALLFDRAGNAELVTVDTVAAGLVTIDGGLVRAWPRGSMLAPVWPMFSSAPGTVSRTPGNDGAEIGTVAQEVGFMDPFLSDLFIAPLTMFDGLPVLDIPATGTSFEQGFDTGAEWFDYGGVVEYRNRWQHTQMQFPRTYLCQRVLQPFAWNWWRAFAEYAKGSLNPFYVPTWRNDFELIAPAMPNGSTLTFAGEEYADEWAPFAAFKGLVIRSANGIHYAKTTGVAKVNGNTVVTFAPKLPNVAGWQIEQQVGLLLKARIADDMVSCEHHALHTLVSLNMRTVDE